MLPSTHPILIPSLKSNASSTSSRTALHLNVFFLPCLRVALYMPIRLMLLMGTFQNEIFQMVGGDKLLLNKGMKK